MLEAGALILERTILVHEATADEMPAYSVTVQVTPPEASETDAPPEIVGAAAAELVTAGVAETQELTTTSELTATFAAALVTLEEWVWVIAKTGELSTFLTEVTKPEDEGVVDATTPEDVAEVATAVART